MESQVTDGRVGRTKTANDVAISLLLEVSSVSSARLLDHLLSLSSEQCPESLVSLACGGVLAGLASKEVLTPNPIGNCIGNPIEPTLDGPGTLGCWRIRRRRR